MYIECMTIATATSVERIARMRCAKHKSIRVIPDGCVVENGTYVRRADDNRWSEGRVLCGEDGCRFYMKAHYIEGRVKDSIACDDRCRSATGNKCQCQCGGRKHGIED